MTYRLEQSGLQSARETFFLKTAGLSILSAADIIIITEDFPEPTNPAG